MSEETQEKLELKNYMPSDEGLSRLLPVVKNTRNALLASCNLGVNSCKYLESVLKLENCSLKELDLSNNDLQDSGVELLSAGLKSSHCKLEILRLALCNLGKEACTNLESVLKLETSSLKELDISNNDLQDIGVEILSAGLKSSHCKLKILRLAFCNLGKKACENLESVLKLETSTLKELLMSNNDIQDSGVEVLSAGLKSLHCKLETLGLSGCMITEKGCSSLASALSSKPSYLKELDLTYNHLGESGIKLLSARLEDPECTLNKLQVDHGGENRIKPGLKKYSLSLMTAQKILNGCCKMSNITEVLLNTLQNLLEEDLKSFQWHLKNGVEGFPPIQKAHLEKADRHDTVDQMVQKYQHNGAVEITLAILKKMNQNQVADELMTELRKEESQEKFELKKYKPSDEGLWRLLRVVKNTRQALLDHCNLSKDGCETLASVLSSDSAVRELDLSNNELQDSGVEKLSAGLKNSHCQLQILRLAFCNLGEKTCEYLESVLKLENSSLKELDLSHNDLQDMGVVLLSPGLNDSHCKLQILRLSGCMITENGCSSLASALTSNPSHLKELHLTYNHPGESGVRLLSARLEDPHCALNTLRMEHGGKIRINPGPKKYSCDLTLDPNTAHTRLSLCEQNRKVVCVREHQSHPDHPERFDEYQQVLCRESLTGLCYWEAEWSGWEAAIALTYKSISRKGSNNDCDFGWNNKSWILYCFSDKSYSVCHNSEKTEIPAPPSSSKRVGVYVDCPSGTLSFYSVSPGIHTLNHLHTFTTTFTEPLYVGFRLYDAGSSVCVFQIE
ncbi:hypothetical protein MHYP_G00090580 [Metynnis hypsauchen]